MLDISDNTEKTLQYLEMTNWYEDVVEAHPETFASAFKDPTEEQFPWSNLPHWLSSDNGIY
jgi:hypothetical protein